jgi:hypothetical protein
VEPEYSAVVIPVMTQHFAMLQRNLLYTGVSGWAEGGRRYRGAQRLRPTALVETGGMVERGRLEALRESGVTVPSWGVNCIVSSMQMSALRPVADGSLRRNK